MREFVKTMAKEIVPRLPRSLAYHYIGQIEARWSPPAEWQAAQSKRQVLARKLVEMGLPLQVMSGPFKGMKYVGVSCGSTLAPKLLGTYELEVHAAVETLCCRDTDVIFNLGAAEGYYAVGMAMRMPRVQAIAYDWWGPAHYWLRRIAYENGVLNRVKTRGRCATEELAASIGAATHPMVICDVEGAEDELLDQVAVPALVRADILVELHDMDKPGVSQRVRDRFAKSHVIEEMLSRPRTSADLPAPFTGRGEEWVQLMDERRQGAQSWYLMIPRHA